MTMWPGTPVWAQPGLRVAFSSVADGSIAAGGGNADELHHIENAQRFVKDHFEADAFTKVLVTYSENNSYQDVSRVTPENAGKPLKADALYTTEPGSVITLPVADCIATVVYDSVAGLLGVLHLGRHASVAGLIEAFADEVQRTCHSEPRNWCVWMSPGLRAEHDIMEYFSPVHSEQWAPYVQKRDDGRLNIDIPGHNQGRFEALGVRSDNITISPIDTYVDERYFSHRAATELGMPEREGRMMVAAALDMK